MKIPSRRLWIALPALMVVLAGATACASTKEGSGSGQRMDLLTREQILGASATNLFEVVQRLRPQWLRVSTTRSFNLDSEIVVFQNEMQLGGPDALRQLVPELAYEMEWVDGVKAASMLPGLMSGRHIEGVIIVRTRSE